MIVSEVQLEAGLNFLFSSKYQRKKLRDSKLDFYWKIIGIILDIYWKFNRNTNIGKRDTLTNIGKSFIVFQGWNSIFNLPRLVNALKHQH